MNYIVDTKKRKEGGSTHGCLSRGAPLDAPAGCTHESIPRVASVKTSCGCHPWEYPAGAQVPLGCTRGCPSSVAPVGLPVGCARRVATRGVPSTGCNRGGLHCQPFPNGYPKSRCFCYVDLALDDIISTVTFQFIKRKGERSFREQSPEEQRIFEENSESRVF